MTTSPISSLAPLLLFDSGLGGLTVFDATRRLLPSIPIVYAADYGALPYGERSEEEIAARVPAILGRLVERYQPSLICIACNTASTIALGAVRTALDLPIVGTVPAIKPAAEISRTRTIGLLGTKATIRQAYVDNLHSEFAADCRLLRYASGNLVDAAERKMRGEHVADAVFDEAIDGLIGQTGGAEIDVIVLACTHFPLVADELRAAAKRAGLPDTLRFIDGAEGIARRIAHLAEASASKADPISVFVATAKLDDSLTSHSALQERGFRACELLHSQARPIAG